MFPWTNFYEKKFVKANFNSFAQAVILISESLKLEQI